MKILFPDFSDMMEKIKRFTGPKRSVKDTRTFISDWNVIEGDLRKVLEDSGETIETIPSGVAFIGNRELTEDEIEYGRELEGLALKYLGLEEA